MSLIQRLRHLLPLLCLSFGCPLMAQTDATGGGQRDEHAAGEAVDWKGDLVTTHHSVVLDSGERLHYQATAGTMPLPDYKGETRADVFFVAYTKTSDAVFDPARRPILFAFNGGPGSSSVWLHMGALGPRRVVMGDTEGAQPSPPGAFVENAHTWLDLADLVFIDPVSTGFSRPAPEQSKGQFHGLNQDASSVGDFIRLYLTRYERWASPRYLAGESYGTTRAAALAGYLQGEYGLFLNGIVLVSPVLNFQTVRFSVGNDTPYWLFLPTYTATAWYHGQLPPRLQNQELERTLQEVEEFAKTDYLQALAAGDDLDPDIHDNIVSRLADYTGLSQEYIRGTNLRIRIFNFVKELRRDERRVVGRLDSRYTAIERDHIGDGYERDPSYSAIYGVYSSTVNDYVRRELGYENDHPYEILTGRVHPWDYSSHENRYVNVAETLRGAISQNPALRVLSCSGYYDLATPYFAMDYTVSHMGLPPEHRGNITQTYYRSGHMMYVRMEDLEKLKRDVADWME